MCTCCHENLGYYSCPSLLTWTLESTLWKRDKILHSGSLPDCNKLNTGTIKQVVSFVYYETVVTKQHRDGGLSTRIYLTICFSQSSS